jgi:hypothetical protein
MANSLRQVKECSSRIEEDDPRHRPTCAVSGHCPKSS